jgi:hypothetical protein
MYKGAKSAAHCSFLFCGYYAIGLKEHGISSPRIIKFSSYNEFSPAPLACGSYGYGFIGREDHGGVLYLHHRFFPRPSVKLSLESAKCLAYCILAEVIRQDNTVGEPLEMLVIKPSESQPIIDFAPYKDRLRRMEDSVKAFLNEPF